MKMPVLHLTIDVLLDQHTLLVIATYHMTTYEVFYLLIKALFYSTSAEGLQDTRFYSLLKISSSGKYKNPWPVAIEIFFPKMGSNLTVNYKVFNNTI